MGATFYYFLKDAIRSQRDERRHADRAAARSGEDVFYPSWDSLRMEDLEVAPQMILTVTDPEGRIVRRLTGRTSGGVTPVTWDLRYPSLSPIGSGGEGGGNMGFGGGGGSGPYIVPGTYTVSLAKKVRGVITPVGEPRSFEVYILDDVDRPRSAEVLAFEQQAARLARAVLGANSAAGEAMTRVGLLQQALDRTPNADPQISVDLEALRNSLRAVQWAMNGDPTIARRRESTPPSLTTRLRRFTGGWGSLLHEVTGFHREQYDIVAGEFSGILARLRTLIETDLKRIEDAAEAAGAPWTSGRIPNWP